MVSKEELDLETRRLKILRENRKSKVREILTYLAFGVAEAVAVFVVVWGYLNPGSAADEAGIAAWTFIIGSGSTAFGFWWAKREGEKDKEI